MTQHFPTPPGLKYLPYQEDGIRYAMKRDVTLIADEMGLGKTVQAIGVINETKATKVLIICPASLKDNWAREVDRWAMMPLSIGIAYGPKRFPRRDVVIINYDIVNKFLGHLKRIHWDVQILDECHYLKNWQSRRSKHVLGDGGIPFVKKKLMLTGTPLMNRPVELWPLLFPHDQRWGDLLEFGKRYCGASRNASFASGRSAVGWQFMGATRLDELNRLLVERLMIRRLKKDVLKDLPDKIRQVIQIEPPDHVVAAEKDVKEFLDGHMRNHPFEETVKAMSTVSLNGIGEHISRIRRETAVAKIPDAVKFLKGILEEQAKIVVFAWHLDVIAGLEAGLSDYGSVTITGKTPVKDRGGLVEKFQTDPDTRLFFGNMKAAGVGLTLTASSYVLFLEEDWVPANLSQAEDRCHRIGQKDSVLVQHLVYRGSIDAVMLKSVLRKQKIADQAIDGVAAEQ